MSAHFRHVCQDHGTILGQCRCPGPKDDGIKPCPGPPICPAPGFRVDPCTLSDDEAFAAMWEAVNDVTKAALRARLFLLDKGFADDHSLCKELDRTAAQYTEAFHALRHQADGPAEATA